MTDAALAERVFVIEAPPVHGVDGWWIVGRLVDEMSDAEFGVWIDPVRKRVGLSPVEHPTVIAPTPPENPIVFDGERRRWVWRDTREPVSELRHGHGRNE